MTRIKWVAVSIGGIIAVAHIGILGHLIRRPPEPEKVVQVPTINIPHGPYSSYKIEADQEGYKIEYKANDPAILESQRSLDLDTNKKGLFGGRNEKRIEFRSDQYTMEGTRNMGSGGTVFDGEGKLTAREEECLVEDAGARSQGAMAGSAVATGVLVPAVVNIPYIGWLAAGWAALLGQNIGSEAGSQVNSMISDC